MGECLQQKHTQHAPSTKTECDYLNGWIKKTVTYAKISPKRYSWGTQKKQTNKQETTTKSPQPNLLPPAPSAAKYHSYRTYFQVRVWTNINERLLQLDLPEWGWEKQQGMLLPVYTDKAVAPDELLNRVHCICKAACATAVCSCRKHGLVCSVSCSHCRGEICFNSMNWISVEVSDSEPEC